MIRPPFAYFGGKQTLARWIVSAMPEHDAYVEPFAGSLAVLLAKPAALREVVNDLDGEVVNFWRVVREHPEWLEFAMMATPHSRQEHEVALDRGMDDDVERARRWWVRITQSQGQHPRRSGWRWAPSSGVSVPQYLAAYARRVGPAAARLRHVSIENDHAIDVIKRHDRDGAVIYCDPPYLPETINPTSPGYAQVMTREDHVLLAEVLHSCRSTVLLSGYASDLYSDLYGDWDLLQMPTLTSAASIRGPRETRERVEHLWSSRAIPNPAPSLFDPAG
jgi:DNA adenine methylase